MSQSGSSFYRSIFFVRARISYSRSDNLLMREKQSNVHCVIVLTLIRRKLLLTASSFFDKFLGGDASTFDEASEMAEY